MYCTIRHILSLASIACLLMLSACGRGGDTVFMDDEAVFTEEDMVTLVLNTDVIGMTRAGVTDVPDNEKMKTLRIVILHPDGTVEHNKFIDFESGQTEYNTQIFKVKNREKKTIYLLANEKSVNGLPDLDVYTSGMAGFKAAVDDFHFVPVFAQDTPIPMSSVYEIEIGTGTNRIECQYYLVRAATKFTFRFKNLWSYDMKVTGLTVSNIADRMYLMPHKQNPGTPLLFLENDGSKTSLYWVDWLKKVSDETLQYPDDKTLADWRGWINDYDIPGTATQAKRDITPASFTVPKYNNSTPGEAEFYLYLPESKNLINAADPYGEQAYTMDITFEYTQRGKTYTKKFSGEAFDNLRALFRNTHVVVDVALIQGNTITLTYTVCPWLEYTIEIPSFE